MRSVRFPAFAIALILAAVVATALLYLPGLRGPFLFDDNWNLAGIRNWFHGEMHWLRAILPNETSILDSRPVSMASFLLTTGLWGTEPFSYKLGNEIPEDKWEEYGLYQ